MLAELVERLEIGIDVVGFLDVVGEHLEGFIPIARDAYDDRLIPGYSSLLDELLGDRHFCTPRRLGENPLRLGQEPDPIENLFIGDAFSPSS